MTKELKKLIESAWDDRNLINFKEYKEAIEQVILHLDKGEIRVAEQIGDRWHVNDWIKKAVILYFPIREMKEIEVVIRKEIRNFMDNNTIKQFEDKLLDRIGREIKRGKLEGDVKDITLRMFREFYQFMWMNRSYWEPRLKNA
jgi:2,3,4,5-tetrahydropyridine-2,6-dicarboxylate N-succinyltransferase